MQVVLSAKSNEEGGIKGSFENQLAKLGVDGAGAELLAEEGPYRVDSSNEWYFEIRRTYEVAF